MVRIRVGLFFVSALIVGYCGVSLFAQPRATWACCAGNPEDCVGDGGTCCEASSVGMPPCSEELGGYCMKRCIPGGGD